MANGFGALWVGTSGLQSASNGLNITANNLTNVDSTGYVRQQVIYADNSYTQIGAASISNQQSGLGVSIGDVVHIRDVFLDKSYRAENGRASFYSANYDAAYEVETYLQESEGMAFRDAIADLYEAFSEFAKDPSDNVNQNLVMQKSSLFLSRSSAVYQGLKNYQQILNTKISDKVDEINDIGEEIHKLNIKIQQIESAGVETAMDLRDRRDQLLDDLGGLANMSYKESPDGIVKVSIEGTQFVDENEFYKIGKEYDDVTGFITPYWSHFYNKGSENNSSAYVFKTESISAAKNNDIGELKGLLLARGKEPAEYMDIANMPEALYSDTIGNSIVSNSEAEIDSLVHAIITTINGILSPVTEFSGDAPLNAKDASGKDYVLIPGQTRIADTENCAVGSDGKIPSAELFKRRTEERYTAVLADDGNTYYVYNEEDFSDKDSCYTLDNLIINHAMVEEESLLAHKTQNDAIAYGIGEQIEKAWEAQDYKLNPADITPCNFREFYTKWVGEVGTVGSIYRTTAESLTDTTDAINQSRQSIVGVSSDEELTNMIKYQNAYNASSRFINVVNEMISHLLNTLGS